MSLGVIPLEVFWTALILLDAMVLALLLAGWRRPGLLAALTATTLDVAANGYALFGTEIAACARTLVVQAAFLGFVADSDRICMAEIPGV